MESVNSSLYFHPQNVLDIPTYMPDFNLKPTVVAFRVVPPICCLTLPHLRALHPSAVLVSAGEPQKMDGLNPEVQTVLASVDG